MYLGIIADENPLSVQYFQPTIKGKKHSLNSTIYRILNEDLDKKIDAPEIERNGRRLFYRFDWYVSKEKYMLCALKF